MKIQLLPNRTATDWSRVSLALIEMRRAKLRFGLLTVAVSLLIFLVLFLTTLSSALVKSFTGAIEGLDAQVLAYSTTARDNLQASRLEPSTVAKVRKVPGVAKAAGLATSTTSAQLPEGKSDLQVFGFDPAGPGEPTSVTDGRLPTALNEAAVDVPGATLGSTITLEPSKSKLTVVGLLDGAQFSAAPTAYVTLSSYEAVVRAANPKIPFVPYNAIAVTVVPGASAATVADSITADVPALKGYTLDDAVALIPGVESVSQTFGILVALTFIIGIVVIGFFFLILTVQKLRVFTLLRANGASNSRLAGVVAVQITAVVVIAGALAVLLVSGALKGISTGIPVSLSPALAAGTVAAVLVCSLAAGLLSIRRIRKIDPATAAGAR